MKPEVQFSLVKRWKSLVQSPGVTLVVRWNRKYKQFNLEEGRKVIQWSPLDPRRRIDSSGRIGSLVLRWNQKSKHFNVGEARWSRRSYRKLMVKALSTRSCNMTEIFLSPSQIKNVHLQWNLFMSNGSTTLGRTFLFFTIRLLVF